MTLHKALCCVVATLLIVFAFGCSQSDTQTTTGGDADYENQEVQEFEGLSEQESELDEGELEQESEPQPACVGWDNSTPAEDPFAEFCGDQERYYLAEAVRLDKACRKNSVGAIWQARSGDMMAVRLRAERPFHLTTIKARFKGTGRGRLHIVGDYGRSWPNLEQELTDPIDFEVNDENKDKYIEFDLSARGIEIHPRDFFWVVYEQLDDTLRLGIVSGCPDGPSESRFKVQAIIDDWRRQGLAFVWGALGGDAENGYDHFALEVYGEYFCRKVHPFYFSDITDEALTERFVASRTAFVDIDGDGFDDLIVHPVSRREDCNNARVFRNNGDGTFEDVTSGSGLEGTCSNLVAAGDVNNDGCIDLFVGVYTELNDDGTPKDTEHDNGIFLGDCNFHFTRVENSGVEGLDPTAAAAFADYDKDGCLDLFYGNWLKKYPNPPAVKDRLFKGNCDGTFVETTDSAGLGDQGPQNRACYGAIWGDYDNDGDPDLFVMNYGYGENFLWENQGDGTFVDVGEEKGIAKDDEGIYGGNTFGTDLGDINSDGNLDIYLAEISHPRYHPWSDPSRLMVNAGEQLNYTFIDITRQRGIYYDEGEIEPSFIDFDNDGDLDLFISTLYPGHYARLYRQEGDGTFVDITFEAGIEVEYAQLNAWADIDHDGDLDFVVGQHGSGAYLHIFRNDIGNKNHWIQVKLVGTNSNRSAVGARVYLESCGRTQMREVQGGKGHFGSQRSMWLHFGLGQNTKIDKLIVRWTDNSTQEFTEVPIDSFIVITEGDDTFVVVE